MGHRSVSLRVINTGVVSGLLEKALAEGFTFNAVVGDAADRQRSVGTLPRRWA